ncbi:arylsulfatase B-like isoform X1 [Clavelina lepadiformis]|uniref:arylsulfatase B-like isoform X1 n=1 Tax=Clavelina lepadiformis TaxID=159417 RepID=UPI0040421C23
MLTGYYPVSIGMQEGVVTATQIKGLPLNLKLLPEYLQQVGNYTSYVAGKWHLGFCNTKYTPLGRGFSKHYGFYNGHIGYYDHMVGETGETAIDYRNDTTVNYAAYNKYATTDLTDAAIEFIENQNPDEPMFLYMAYNAPHSPFEVDAKYSNLYTKLRGGKRKIYLGMITALDEQVGGLKSALVDREMWDNTVFVFYSDNGGGTRRNGQSGNNYPLRGKKDTLWDGGYRVPAFFHSPLLTNSGYSHNGLFHVSDLFATFVYLASGKDAYAVPSGIDGMNIWESISDNSVSPRNELVYNIIEHSTSSKPPARVVEQAAIRYNNYKLIEIDAGVSVGFGGLNDWITPPENSTDVIGTPANMNAHTIGSYDYYLFDLEEDPYETNNIAATDITNLSLMLTRLSAAKGKAVHAIDSTTSDNGLPSNNGGVWGPGFC